MQNKLVIFTLQDNYGPVFLNRETSGTNTDNKLRAVEMNSQNYRETVSMDWEFLMLKL